MHKLLLAAAAGTCLLGGAIVAQTAQAQPYGYAYVPAPAYHYDGYGRLVYDSPYGVAGAVIGAPIARAYGAVPYDQFGPDPNGMIAADGHRIKCKLTDNWDDRFDRYVTHRVCY